MSRSENWTSEEIMTLSDRGRLIFENELKGSIPNKPINSPIRTDDDSPSFTIFEHEGKYMFKDFGNGEAGDAIKLVRLIYNLSYPKAIDKIVNDLNLKNTERKYQKVIKQSLKIEKLKREPLWEVDTKPFDERHHSYMSQYGLDEEYLNQNDCYALRAWAIEKKLQPFPDNQYKFVYIHKDINGIETGKYKILTLGENVEDKWKTNCPNRFLWRIHVAKNKEEVWIVKSMKDAYVLNKHFGLQTIATQNEDPWILLMNNYEYLEETYERKIVCFGSDFQGWHSSYLITHLTGWNYFNTPNNLYEFEIEDPSDYIANFNVKSLGNLLRIKGFIK